MLYKESVKGSGVDSKTNEQQSMHLTQQTNRNGLGVGMHQSDFLATSPIILNTDQEQFEDRLFLNKEPEDLRSKKLLFSNQSINMYSRSNQEELVISPQGNHSQKISFKDEKPSNTTPKNANNNNKALSRSSNRGVNLESSQKLNFLSATQKQKSSDSNRARSLKPAVGLMIASERIQTSTIPAAAAISQKKQVQSKTIRNPNQSASIAVLRSAQQGIKNFTAQTLRFEKPQQLQAMANSTTRKSDLWGWVTLKRRIDALRAFLRSLELQSMIQIRSRLKHEHMTLIEDQGSNLPNISSSNPHTQFHAIRKIFNFENVLDQMTMVFLKFFSQFPTVNSSSSLIVFFKILLSLQLLYQIFQFPLMVSFPSNPINVFSDDHPVLRFFFVLPFIFELLLNFNLSYYEHGEQITDKGLIIYRYLRWNFWQDLIGVVGSAFVVEDFSWVFVLLIFVIRFLKCKMMYDSIEERFQLSLRFAVPYTLLNLFLSITLVAHVCGCIFQMIAINLQQEGVVTWLEKQNLVHASISERYIASLYFSFITMITVGYGDITPQSKQERIFVIFMTIFSCGVFAYVVSSIGELFSQIQQKEAVFKQQKYEISNYMETRKINSELQSKVFQFLEMLRKKKQQEPQNGENILDIVNPKLRDSIYQNYYGGHLSQWKIFQKNFSEPFLNQLSVSCTEQVYGPGEIIFYQQENKKSFVSTSASTSSTTASPSVHNEPDGFDPNMQNVYLVVKGKVCLYEEELNSRIKRNTALFYTTYSEGECFGLKEFLCGTHYEYTAQSQGLTTVIKVKRQTFTEILKSYPKDLESFAYLRDELMHSNTGKYLKCEPCNRYDHSLYSCPRMHFLRRRYHAIQVHILTFPQERAPYERGRRVKSHALGRNRQLIRYHLKLKRIEIINDLQHEQMNANFPLIQLSPPPNLDQLPLHKSHTNHLSSSHKLYQSQYQHNSTSAAGVPSQQQQQQQQQQLQQQQLTTAPQGEDGNFSLSHIESAVNIPSKPEITHASIRAEIRAMARSDQLSVQVDQMEIFWRRSEMKANLQQQLEEDPTITNAHKTQRLRQFEAIHDLIDVAKEEIDEIFYFSCPLVQWDLSKNTYIVSQDYDEEEECNEAIQQYLEDNFDVDLEDLSDDLSQCQSSHSADSLEESNSKDNEEADSYSDSQDRRSNKGPSEFYPMTPQLLPKINVSGTPTPLEQENLLVKRKSSIRLPKIEEAEIQEEDFVRISAHSLSFDHETVGADNPSQVTMPNNSRRFVQPAEKFVFTSDQTAPASGSAAIVAAAVSAQKIVEDQKNQFLDAQKDEIVMEFMSPNATNTASTSADVKGGLKRKAKKINLKSLRELHAKEKAAALPDQTLTSANNKTEPISNNNTGKGINALRKLRSLIVINQTPKNTLTHGVGGTNEKDSFNFGKLIGNAFGIGGIASGTANAGATNESNTETKVEVDKLKEELIQITKKTRAKLRSLSVREQGPIGLAMNAHQNVNGTNNPMNTSKYASPLKKRQSFAPDVMLPVGVAFVQEPQKVIEKKGSSADIGIKGSQQVIKVVENASRTSNYLDLIGQNISKEAQSISEWIQFQFEFETYQEYTKYYPKSNRSNVLAKLTKLHESSQAEQQKGNKLASKKLPFRRVETQRLN